jgi:hypothetical protein
MRLTRSALGTLNLEPSPVSAKRRRALARNDLIIGRYIRRHVKRCLTDRGRLADRVFVREFCFFATHHLAAIGERDRRRSAVPARRASSAESRRPLRNAGRSGPSSDWRKEAQQLHNPPDPVTHEAFEHGCRQTAFIGRWREGGLRRAPEPTPHNRRAPPVHQRATGLRSTR